MKIIAISDTHLHGASITSNILGMIEDYDIIVHGGDFGFLECYNVFASTWKRKED